MKKKQKKSKIDLSPIEIDVPQNGKLGEIEGIASVYIDGINSKMVCHFCGNAFKNEKGHKEDCELVKIFNLNK